MITSPLESMLAVTDRMIPSCLKRIPNWVCWQAKPNGERIEKIPVCPTTGRFADSTDPESWSDYTTAATLAGTTSSLGVGFVFTKAAGIVGIDLDKCRDPETGTIAPGADEIVQTLQTYTEISPSGTGLHLFVQGTLPAGKRKKGKIEAYNDARFFTVTGNHLPGTSTDVKERNLADFHARYLADEPNPSTVTHEKSQRLSDDGILAKCRSAKNADKFDRLWQGDWSAYPSQSEADLALLGILAFYTHDPAQMDRLFRKSGLLRDKWDNSRGDQTYGARSIEEALSHVTNTYHTASVPNVEPQVSSQAHARPELDCDSGDLDDLTTRTWNLITEHDVPPTLFSRGTLCVRIEVERGRAFFNELTEPRCRHEIARIIQCVKTRVSREEGTRREWCKPPSDLISNLLATPINKTPLPPVREIVEIPTLSPDGVIVQTPGYDAGSQLIYRPYSNIPITIPTTPSREEVAAARETINDLLSDFPFAAKADRCHAVALMLMPFVRPFIGAPAPLYLVAAPTPGSGKGLLVYACLYPSVGRNIGTIADTRNEEEMRKHITARLLEGCPVTFIDNLTRPLDSGVLAAAITATTWNDRRLGKTETIRVPVETTWVVSANNPTLSMEIARRSIQIRLDPRRDQPWMRDGWQHPQLMDYVQCRRSDLVTACLTLIQDWLCAGQPAPHVKPLGSFERWTHVVGGILEHAGFQGFLENALDFYAEADTDGAIWRTFTEEWWDAHQAEVVSVNDLFKIAKELDGLSLGKSATDRGQRTALGSQLRKRRDQVIGPYRIEVAGKSHNAQLWRLRQVGDRTPSSVQPEEIVDL